MSVLVLAQTDPAGHGRARSGAADLAHARRACWSCWRCSARLGVAAAPRRRGAPARGGALERRDRARARRAPFARRSSRSKAGGCCSASRRARCRSSPSCSAAVVRAGGRARHDGRRCPRMTRAWRDRDVAVVLLACRPLVPRRARSAPAAAPRGHGRVAADAVSADRRRRRGLGAAADRRPADAAVVPAGGARDDDVVHAHRHRLPLPAAGARHAGDAVEPDADRPDAVPDDVHHGAGGRRASTTLAIQPAMAGTDRRRRRRSSAARRRCASSC